MVRKRIVLGILLWIPTLAFSQRECPVHGKSLFVVTDQSDITLADAKRKCIEQAKAEAIKEEFGEIVVSDIVDTNIENGSSSTSYFWENTAAMSKGEWLSDTRQPQITVEYKDGSLFFSAEVWGTAREITQAKADLDWDILKDINNQKGVTTFENGERIYLRIRVPVNGYLAVYLTVGDGTTSCLLPYPKNTDGRYYVQGGTEHILFDKSSNNKAQIYRMTTVHAREINQIVVIYSPNAFTKCNDLNVDSRHPSNVATTDFQKWLTKCQRNDKDMVVERKWITIHNSQTNN